MSGSPGRLPAGRGGPFGVHLRSESRTETSSPLIVGWVGEQGAPLFFAATHRAFFCSSRLSTTPSTEPPAGRGPSGSARSAGPGVGLGPGLPLGPGLGLDRTAGDGLVDGAGDGPAATESAPIAITAARDPLSSGVIVVWPPPPARRRSVAL